MESERETERGRERKRVKEKERQRKNSKQMYDIIVYCYRSSCMLGAIHLYINLLAVDISLAFSPILDTVGPI